MFTIFLIIIFYKQELIKNFKNLKIFKINSSSLKFIFTPKFLIVKIYFYKKEFIKKTVEIFSSIYANKAILYQDKRVNLKSLNLNYPFYILITFMVIYKLPLIGRNFCYAKEKRR